MFYIFAAMNLLINFFRCVIFTVIIIPMWFLSCLAEFFTTVILHYLHLPKANVEIKYRNNIKEIFHDFQYNFISIFYY